MDTHSSYYSAVVDRMLVVTVTLLEVSKREVGIVALQLSTGPLKIRSGLEWVQRCEPSPLADYLATAPSGLVLPKLAS